VEIERTEGLVEIYVTEGSWLLETSATEERMEL